MTFESESLNPNSFKICLLEIDLLNIINSQWINFSAGVWHFCFDSTLGKSGINIIGSDGSIGYYEEPTVILRDRVGDIFIDNVQYYLASDLSDLQTTASSYYYDAILRILYIHFTDSGLPFNRVVKLGIINGFCDKVGPINGAYYNNIYYEPRILNVPSLKKTKDILFYGILKYSGGSVELINSDGYFENILSLEFIGSPIRMYLGFDGLDFSEFRQVYTGIIQDYNYDFEKFKINIADARQYLTRSIPIRKFDIAEYPYIAEGNAGEVKPLAYGFINNAPLICTNEDQIGAASFNFYVCDVTDHPIVGVTTVYLKGFIVAGGSWSYNSATGLITIASGVTVTAGSEIYAIEDNLSDVSATFTGYNIVKGSDIIKDILNLYANKNYITTYYDLTEWALAELSSRDCGLYIDKETKINQIIESICVSDDASFIIEDNGKFTNRIYNENRIPVKTILSDEWLDPPKFQIKSAELLSSVKINYKKNIKDNNFSSINNNIYEGEVFSFYKIKNEKTFETILSDSADATDKAETVMLRSKTMQPTITRKTKTQNIDLEITDFIIAEHDRESATTKTWNIYEIIGINKNINTAEITLEMKYVKLDDTTKYSYSDRIESGLEQRQTSDGDIRIIKEVVV